MRTKRSRSRVGPMATQPNFGPEETQATPMTPIPTKRTSKTKRIGALAISQSKAEITRNASLKKQRGLLRQAGEKNQRHRKV
jgi:hypothetical protein